MRSRRRGSSRRPHRRRASRTRGSPSGTPSGRMGPRTRCTCEWEDVGGRGRAREGGVRVRKDSFGVRRSTPSAVRARSAPRRTRRRRRRRSARTPGPHETRGTGRTWHASAWSVASDATRKCAGFVRGSTQPPPTQPSRGPPRAPEVNPESPGPPRTPPPPAAPPPPPPVPGRGAAAAPGTGRGPSPRRFIFSSTGGKGRPQWPTQTPWMLSMLGSPLSPVGSAVSSSSSPAWTGMSSWSGAWTT